MSEEWSVASLHPRRRITDEGGAAAAAVVRTASSQLLCKLIQPPAVVNTRLVSYPGFKSESKQHRQESDGCAYHYK